MYWIVDPCPVNSPPVLWRLWIISYYNCSDVFETLAARAVRALKSPAFSTPTLLKHSIENLVISIAIFLNHWLVQLPVKTIVVFHFKYYNTLINMYRAWALMQMSVVIELRQASVKREQLTWSTLLYRWWITDEMSLFRLVVSWVCKHIPGSQQD